MEKQDLNEDSMSDLLKGLREAKGHFLEYVPDEPLTIWEMPEILSGIAAKLHDCNGELQLTMKELNTMIFCFEKITGKESLQEIFNDLEKQEVFS